MLSKLIKLAEDGYLPDFLIRMGIRRLCKVRLDWKNKVGPEIVEKHHQEWVEKLKKSPLALVPEKANEQHYEVPPEFFNLVLGENLKYSSGYWPNKDTSFNESESIRKIILAKFKRYGAITTGSIAKAYIKIFCFVF